MALFVEFKKIRTKSNLDNKKEDKNGKFKAQK